jgi:hypothetical protein
MDVYVYDFEEPCGLLAQGCLISHPTWVKQLTTTTAATGSNNLARASHIQANPIARTA